MSDSNEVQTFEGVRIHRGNANPESELVYRMRVVDLPMLLEAEMEIADARMQLVDLDGAIELMTQRFPDSKLIEGLETERRELRERLALHQRRK